MARSHAVVLGSGMAGLMAARVLADSFEHVTVVERDQFPSGGEGRPGVPQDSQWHVLMPPAAAIMEELHPGLLAELESADVPVLHHLRDTRIEVAGHALCREGELPMPWHLPSRPVLESHLRARTSTRVLMRPGVVARELVVSDGRVVGVVLDTVDGPERLSADLVIDATAGDLALPDELPAPAETRLDVDLRQVTATVSVQTVPSSVEPLLMHGPHVARPYGLAVSRVSLWRMAVHRDGLPREPPADGPRRPARLGRAVAAAALVADARRQRLVGARSVRLPDQHLAPLGPGGRPARRVARHRRRPAAVEPGARERDDQRRPGGRGAA